MRAALVSLGSKSSKMTASAMTKYFDEVDMLSLQDMEVNIGANGCEVLHEGIKIKKYDCIYAKGSYKYAALLRAIATASEKVVKYQPIKPSSFTLCHDKLLTHLKLLTSQIPMPRTYITASAQAAKDILQRITYPIVMKLPAGTQGKGVMFADSYSSASSMLDTLMAIRQPFIIQEYLESGGVDIRAIVVGDNIVASMKRHSVGGEKRSNIHAGGIGEPCVLDSKTCNIALKAAKAVGAEICGVDLIETAKGPMVLEVNLSPGLQGITQSTGIDVAKEIAKFLSQKTKEKSQEFKPVVSTTSVLGELGISAEAIESKEVKEIISDLVFRGERILLPDVVSKITGFKEDKEYVIKAKKGEVVIKEF